MGFSTPGPLSRLTGFPAARACTHPGSARGEQELHLPLRKDHLLTSATVSVTKALKGELPGVPAKDTISP